jgi:hypothetical protein
MPTINEVWEQAQQINANLVTLHNDLTSLNNCCSTTNQHLNALISRVEETNDWLEEVRQLVNDGFAAMAAGFASVNARQDITNILLRLQIEQNKTMICIMEYISRNSCELLNHSERQTAFQEKIAGYIFAVRHMFATSNPEAALTFDREEEQRQRIEECCPPEPEELPCTYESCPKPEEVREQTPPLYAGFEARATKVKRHKSEDIR